MNKTILAAAILAMAAFAGVMIVGDDTDATAGDGLGQYTVTYSLDGSSIVKKMDTGNEFTFQSASDILPGYEPTAGKEFKGWTIDGSTVYQVGVPYAFTASVEVEPYEVDIVASITLVYGDVEFKINAVDASSAIDNVAVVAKIGGTEGFAAKAGLTYADSKLILEGYQFMGFLKAGATEPVEINEVSAAAHENAVFTVVFDKIYTVTFVANGMTIGTCNSNEFKQIEDPSMPNFKFLGWDVDGVRVSEVVDGKIVIPATYKIEKDTQFDAVFEPIQLTITLIVGEYSSTQPALYGQKITAPALPEGYVAWMLGEKEFDFSTPITENITVVALKGEPATEYVVTFEIEGRNPVNLDSENYKTSIPDTAREGYAFQGWVVKGASQYVDPMTYEITGDITFVAVYKEVAPPEPEQPKFYQTPLGQCAIILAVFVVGLVFYGIFTGRIAVPKFKISRVEKTEEPVEQVEEEKKP